MRQEKPVQGLLNAPFWIALGFGLLCVVAGVAFVFFAPHLRNGAMAPLTLGNHARGR